MRILLLLGFLALANAENLKNRQTSLQTLSALRTVISDYQLTYNATLRSLSEAKLLASNALHMFYHVALEKKNGSLLSLLEFEQDLLDYPNKLGIGHGHWCWINNDGIINGTMGWAGNEYSSCIKALNNSIASTVSDVYDFFTVSENNFNQYRPFAVFELRNIIGNPHLVMDAINALKQNITDIVPEFNSTVAEFVDKLSEAVPRYTTCLDKQIGRQKENMEKVKLNTKQCLEEY